MRENKTTRWKGAGLALAVALVLASAPVMVAYADDDQRRPPAPGVDDDESMRDELAETIEIYMMARMKRFLSLTDDQEHKLVPLVEDLFSSRREANRKRRLISMRLRLLLEDEGAKDQEISGLIDQLEEIDVQLHQKEMKVRSETRSCLAPRQQARFIMFQERFRQEIQDRLRRLQQGEGPPPAGGPRRSPPPTGPGGWPPPRR